MWYVWMLFHVTDGAAQNNNIKIWSMYECCYRGLRAKTLHQRMMYEPILSQGATCENITLTYDVWTNIATGGYVRKHYTNVWGMNECCYRGESGLRPQKKTSLKRGQGWLFWLCYSFLRIYFGFTFSIITLNINICFKCCKCLQNFMLLCNHVWRFKKILFVKDFEAQIL